MEDSGVFITERALEHWYRGRKMLSTPLDKIPLLEAKNGIFMDKRGRRYKIVQGKRVPLKSDVVVQTKHPPGLKSFMKGKARKVQSSYIKAVKYSPEDKVLRVEFHNKPGVWFRYNDIDEQTAQSFHVAESKGKFFHANIKGKEYTQETKEDPKNKYSIYNQTFSMRDKGIGV